ncbi:MucBP domain-containing protein [Anaerococcus nagyae]|uniref:MucBP domain-containing protein n=1 Tax=Anaerococcus nagyae TaxID=1755241 RepID=UPI00324753BB
MSDNWNANGKSQFISNDEKTGEYKQVFYINPNKDTITASDNHNISFYIDGVYGKDGDWKKLLYPQDNTTVTVNKVSQNETLPDAVYENPVNYDGDSDTDVIYNFNDTGDIVVDFKSQSIDSSYVVTVTSKAPAGIGPYTLFSKGTIYGNPQREENLVLGNGIINRGGDASGTDIKKRGSFQEHHIYQTKKLDGTIVEDSRDDKEVTEGTEKENYETKKQDKEGYTLVKVESKNGGQFNEDGSLKEAAYIADTKQEVTYIYQKEEKEQTPIEETGKFQEHHIYITKDKDGNEIDRKVVDGDVSGGTKDMTYTTGKDEKDGFKFVRTENPVEEPNYNEQGETTTGNFKPGVTQEITYVYEKEEKEQTPIEETGKFQEHHIYITKDKDGNEIDRKVVDGDVSGGTKDMTYTTGKDEKDGFKFVRTENPVEEPNYNEQGETTTGNFKPGVTQEITYVYEKEEKEQTPIEETGKFQEHHIYITKDKDGNEIDRKVVDGDVSGGTKDMTYTTGKDEKDGFKFVRTENPVEEPNYNEQGETTTGNFKPGVTQEITYVYEKEEKEQTPIEETGKFQEHHIYITKDKDGNEIDRKVVDGDVSGGTKDMTYTTGKDEKDGFKFVRTENPVEEPNYNEQGETTTGNFKPGVTQEITYVYEKEEKEQTPIEETGKFQEHHIYITKDKDGNEIDRKVVDGDVSGGTKDMTYTTGKDEKDGFKFVRTENPVEEPNYNEQGETTTGNFKPGVTQEITYVYEKEEKEQTPIEETGKFQEHHIYITKDKDGNEIDRKVVDGDVSGGTKDMTYTTGKDEKDGFKFVRTENPVEEPNYNEQGETTTGNFKPGVTQEITYVYEKEEKEQTPIEETGKFQEHHIYITKDKDGNEIDRKVVDGDVSGGTKDMTYTTGKDEKDGFKFVRTENPVEEPNYNEQGETTTGNFKPGVTQEITYVYEKEEKEQTPIEETGKFQEHHIYITKDKDGNEIDRKVVDGDVSGGTKDMTYTTGKDEKDGFKFVRTENPVEEPNYNEQGETTTGNFKPGVTQEITYVYEKEEKEQTPIEETGKFQEHHIYITKDKDGNEIDRKVVDGDVSGGTKDMTYTTGKDEKDGFKFVRTENPVEEPNYNEQGETTTGNFKPGVTQEITYVYEKEEKEQTPIEETGKFQEHHIYITKDKDGNEIDRKVVDGDVSGGTKDMTYTTGKDEKDGFKFVRTENPVEEPNYNEQGETTTGNFKPGVTQEITYVYEKEEKEQTPIEETGKFQEHHIYITKDKDGNEIDRKVVDGDVSGGTKDMTYTTGKDEKDGFKFVRTENPVEEPNYNEQGETTTGNFKPGVTQEITYVYEKEEKEQTPIEETGKFQEHHIYITKDKDGNEIDRKVVDGDVSGGTKDMTYTTGKDEKDGFKFVRTENPVEEPNYNEQGETTTGNFKPGVTQEITYVYEKEEKEQTPIEETGKFQEHHIYITKDKDGNEIDRKVVDGDVSGGTKDMTYTTGKDEKDGFKFVRTENPVEEPNYNEQGETTTGNFKPGVTQEITYVYEKEEKEQTPIEETGKFQEHHIYITKDENGKEITREKVDGKESEGTIHEFYNTGKKEKDGYKFVRTEDAKNTPIVNEDGSESAGNYVPGKKQEITYVYEKTVRKENPTPEEPVEEKGTFQEHHVYITKDENGKEITREKVDGKESEGTIHEFYNTGKKEKDGYKFVRTEDAKNTPIVNEDGSESAGNYVPGKKQEITYVYEKTVRKENPTPEEPVEEKGTFQEHHVYITKDENGKEITREKVDGKESEGTIHEFYNTGKKEKDGYKFVRTEDAKNTPIVNEDGSESAGNYVPGKKQEITYVYEKTVRKENPTPEEPVEEKGTFQEHHVYITKDENGKEITREKVDGKESEGTIHEFYNTGKKEKDGYKFVRTEDAKNTPIVNEDGSESAGNYVPGKKQEITYVYEKTVRKENPTPEEPVEEKGTFQEHHVYITKDENGKEITREKVDGKESEGTIHEFYNTGKKEKDGYKFVRTEDAKNTPIVNEDGSESAGNYVPGKKQEITYVYEKIVKTPVKPSKPENQGVPLTPLEPADSVDPEVSETHEKTEVIKVPRAPQKVEKAITRKSNNKSNNPKTGVGSSAGIVGVAISSILASLGLGKKKKEDEN